MNRIKPESQILMRQIFLHIIALVWIASAGMAEAQDRVLFQFDQAENSNGWQSVNDGVMGGRSDGRFKINTEQNLEFFGTLSLENNGGFASVRARAKIRGLKRSDSLVLRVRGDGRQYNFNLYSQSNLGGYSYRQPFKTKKNEWVEVELPLSKFVATWRGNKFPNEVLDLGSVAGLGILLGDKKPGAFKLEVDWIKARSKNLGPQENGK